jgi:hypothetical protein
MLKPKARAATYAEYGIKHCWYVDPIAKNARSAGADRRGKRGCATSSPETPSKKWLLTAAFKDADPVTAPPFEVHTFPLDVLWV